MKKTPYTTHFMPFEGAERTSWGVAGHRYGHGGRHGRLLHMSKSARDIYLSHTCGCKVLSCPIMYLFAPYNQACCLMFFFFENLVTHKFAQESFLVWR